eukprot:gene28670-24747_t
MVLERRLDAARPPPTDDDDAQARWFAEKAMLRTDTTHATAWCVVTEAAEWEHRAAELSRRCAELDADLIWSDELRAEADAAALREAVARHGGPQQRDEEEGRDPLDPGALSALWRGSTRVTGDSLRSDDGDSPSPVLASLLREEEGRMAGALGALQRAMAAHDAAAARSAALAARLAPLLDDAPAPRHGDRPRQHAHQHAQWAQQCADKAGCYLRAFVAHIRALRRGEGAGGPWRDPVAGVAGWNGIDVADAAAVARAARRAAQQIAADGAAEEYSRLIDGHERAAALLGRRRGAANGAGPRAAQQREEAKLREENRRLHLQLRSLSQRDDAGAAERQHGEDLPLKPALAAALRLLAHRPPPPPRRHARARLGAAARDG